MKCKKIVSSALALIMAFAMFVVAVPTASAVSNEVSLIYAYCDVGMGASPYNSASVRGYVEVANIGYAKNVNIHYTYDGSTWEDAAAEYVAATWGNKEAWCFETGSKPLGYRGTLTAQFAISYEVNGQTYWDNNNGNNYVVQSGGYGAAAKMAFGVGALRVDTDYTYASNNDFRCSIVLDNKAYQKDVKVRFSTDGWDTYTEASANYSYSNTADNTETWYFSSNLLPDDWTTLEFAASYTVNGVTYWDNNFGANYVINR